MKRRTKEFALRVLKLVDRFPNSRSGNAIANQLVRSGTSVAANYRSLRRAKSRANFINKASIVEEEADESCFWLEMIVDADLFPPKRVNPFLQEANEITAILAATRKTTLKRSSK